MRADREVRPHFESIRIPLALIGLALSGLLADPALGEEFLPIDEYLAEDGLSGDDIYQRMLDNRFQSYDQDLKLRSGDAAGHFQDVQLRLRYKNFRSKSKRVLSKTIAKYFSPPDVRHLGYLVINKKSGPDDQFIYRPSSRKVRRINVRSESITGTDFSFEDVVPAEFEDGRHYRLPDGEVEGRPTFVVAVVPLPDTESDYSKWILHVEKEHFVPIRTHYWDNKRVLVKRLDAEIDSLTGFEDLSADSSADSNADSNDKGKGKGDDKGKGSAEAQKVWIALRSRMEQLKTGSFTTLKIDRFEANPRLRERDFSQRELTASH